MGFRTSEDVKNRKSSALAGIKPRVIGFPDLSWRAYRKEITILVTIKFCTEVLEE
jgi:hypothetical protein